MRHFIIGLIYCLLQYQTMNAQSRQQPTLGDFFEKLQTIQPIRENLKYDTFPAFDFEKFVPLQIRPATSRPYFVVGQNHQKKICTVICVASDGRRATLSVYDFSSFKILTLKKEDITLNQYPDFPIFCISESSRFIVYLDKRFESGRRYTSSDIATLQILREDLFPVYTFALRDKFVRMVSEVDYVNGRSKIVNGVRVMFVFQAEKDPQLLISDQNMFSEECYIPKADFAATLHPKIIETEMPFWFYTSEFKYQ